MISAFATPRRVSLFVFSFPLDLYLFIVTSHTYSQPNRLFSSAASSVTDLLHTNGYATGHMGKWHRKYNNTHFFADL